MCDSGGSDSSSSSSDSSSSYDDSSRSTHHDDNRHTSSSRHNDDISENIILNMGRAALLHQQMLDEKRYSKRFGSSRERRRREIERSRQRSAEYQLRRLIESHQQNSEHTDPDKNKDGIEIIKENDSNEIRYREKKKHIFAVLLSSILVLLVFLLSIHLLT